MRYDLCCFGELLVDFVASPAGESLANSVTFEKCAGGAPANVAVGATRLGCKTALIAKVGADPFGDFLVSCMRDNKVNVEGISRAPNVRTTLAFVSLMKNGERDFTFFRNPGADTEIATKGRHDPCVGIRGAPVVEAMMACVLADAKLRHRAQTGRDGPHPDIPGVARTGMEG